MREERWPDVGGYLDSGGSLDDLVLPMRLYASGLSGQGLSLTGGFLKVMSDQATQVEDSLKTLRKAAKKRDTSTALACVSDIQRAVRAVSLVFFGLLILRGAFDHSLPVLTALFFLCSFCVLCARVSRLLLIVRQESSKRLTLELGRCRRTRRSDPGLVIITPRCIIGTSMRWLGNRDSASSLLLSYFVL